MVENEWRVYGAFFKKQPNGCILMTETFRVSDKVELFPQKGGWHFIRIPKAMTKPLAHKADRGVIAVKATVGKTSWDTSLLPMGDDTHFIALNAKVRKNENIKLGNEIEIVFILRE